MRRIFSESKKKAIGLWMASPSCGCQTLQFFKPVQGSPVEVRIGVYNKGKKRAGSFRIQWWASENYREPAREWGIESMAARGGRVLTHTYEGYPSRNNQLITKVVIDPYNEVGESDEENNIFITQIRVERNSAAVLATPRLHSIPRNRVDLRCQIADKELKVAYLKDFRWRIKFKIEVIGEGFSESLQNVHVRYVLHKGDRSIRYERSYRIGILSPGERHSKAVDLK